MALSVVEISLQSSAGSSGYAILVRTYTFEKGWYCAFLEDSRRGLNENKTNFLILKIKALSLHNALDNQNATEYLSWREA